MRGIAVYIARFLWEACARPLLVCLGLYSYDNDATHGRGKVPFSVMELRLHNSGDVDVWFGKALLNNGRDWCWYQVWESKGAPRPPDGQRRPDIIFAHGTGVHSGTLASHSRRFLDAGFRLIVPDLVSHGYSTGIHVCCRNMKDYAAGLRAVLHDVARHDDVRDQRCDAIPLSRSHHQATFLLGISFGGTVALHYALDFPNSLRSSKAVQEGKEIPIDGINVVGPVLGYSSKNIAVPKPLALLVLALDKLGAGSLELVVPHKGCLDKDPKLYKAIIDRDPRSHRGAFRVGHFMCINEGIVQLHQGATSFHHAVYVQQGGQDRVACPRKTIEWIRRSAAQDKRLGVYPVCQHVVYKKAKTAEEDLTGRVMCIRDSIDWMQARIPGTRATEDEHDSHDDRSLAEGASATSSSGRGTVSPSPNSSTTTLPDEASIACADQEDCNPSLQGRTSIEEWARAGQTTLPSDQKPTSRSCQANYDRMSLLHTALGAQQSHPPGYTTKVVTIMPEEEVFDHPLLAAAHQTTLPTLNALCTRRRYRPDWIGAKLLCPYDVDVYPDWSAEHRARLEEQARHSWSLSTFT